MEGEGSIKMTLNYGWLWMAVDVVGRVEWLQHYDVDMHLLAHCHKVFFDFWLRFVIGWLT